MDLKEFHHELLANVRLTAEASKDFVRTSFVDEAGARLTEAEEINDFQSCHFEGIGQRKRRLQVDGYAVDDADGSMALVIADFFNDDIVQTFGAVEARRSFSALRAFVEESACGNLTHGAIDEAQPGFGLAKDLQRLMPTIVRFRFYLVTDGELSTRIHEWPEEDIDGIPIEFHIWDIARFHRAHESISGRDTLEVSFVEGGWTGIPSLQAGGAEGEYQAFLCVIPAELLARIYDRHGSRLLEGNVRSFLSTKGKVNSGIQTTIYERPEMFFAYNNGIAATAEAIALDAGAIPRIVNATNLQIVNGGQTTASLALALRNGSDLSQVSVQMKLSVLPPQKAGELIPLIARFANSQNKVNDADFFANHPFHIRLEDLSRRIWTPAATGTQYGTHWFYERARGQYLNEQTGLKRSEKDQFLLRNPKAQLLTKTDIAKLENTWRGFPHKVSLGAQKNFLSFAEWVSKEWNDDDEQFDESYYRYIVGLAILFRHTEKLVSKQPWYQGGYRANIVTYSLAKLQYLILKKAKGSQLDMALIWNDQSVSDDVSEQILEISAAVFKVLTSPRRPKDNVTEWAKMTACWTQVQDAEVGFNEEIVGRVRDIKLERAMEDAAAGVQPVGYGLFAKTAVMGIEGRTWEIMRLWGVEKNILSSRESDLLRAASRLPRFVPSGKDCEKILKIKSKLVGRGFEM